MKINPTKEEFNGVKVEKIIAMHGPYQIPYHELRARWIYFAKETNRLRNALTMERYRSRMIMLRVKDMKKHVEKFVPRSTKHIVYTSMILCTAARKLGDTAGATIRNLEAISILVWAKDHDIFSQNLYRKQFGRKNTTDFKSAIKKLMDAGYALRVDSKGGNSLKYYLSSEGKILADAVFKYMEQSMQQTYTREKIHGGR